jgi:hypothetical protein
MAKTATGESTRRVLIGAGIGPLPPPARRDGFVFSLFWHRALCYSNGSRLHLFWLYWLSEDLPETESLGGPAGLFS